MFRSILTLSLIFIGLGLNFIFTKPTFNPYHINYVVIGSIFLGLGLAKILFLVILRRLKILRAVMALGIIFMIFWGIGTSITFFQGKTSLQLFVLYMGLVLLEVFLLFESPINVLINGKKNNVGL